MAIASFAHLELTMRLMINPLAMDIALTRFFGVTYVAVPTTAKNIMIGAVATLLRFVGARLVLALESEHIFTTRGIELKSRSVREPAVAHMLAVHIRRKLVVYADMEYARLRSQ